MTSAANSYKAKLKPCPFCGGEAVERFARRKHIAECKVCGTRADINLWNGRAEENQRPTLIEECAQICDAIADEVRPGHKNTDAWIGAAQRAALRIRKLKDSPSATVQPSKESE